MKTSAIIALSIVGVLGTAGAAMAVNGTTLASFSQGTIGQATDVLVPSSDPTDEPTGTPSPTATHDAADDNSVGDDDNGLRGDGTVDDDSTSGGVSQPSPSPSHSEDSDDDSEHSDDDSDDSGHDTEDDD